MLLQTNSYIVPREKRTEHARLMSRFRQCFRRLGSGFEVYEQTGPNFTGEGGGRFVQIMRFRDRRHQQQVHAREKSDPTAQRLIAEFCQLLNIQYQQQNGLFAAGFYTGVLREATETDHEPAGETEPAEPSGAQEPAEPPEQPPAARVLDVEVLEAEIQEEDHAEAPDQR